eukprot:PhF_6_TR3309/c0_g1_i2/m.4668
MQNSEMSWCSNLVKNGFSVRRDIVDVSTVTEAYTSLVSLFSDYTSQPSTSTKVLGKYFKNQKTKCHFEIPMHLVLSPDQEDVRLSLPPAVVRVAEELYKCCGDGLHEVLLKDHPGIEQEPTFQGLQGSVLRLWKYSGGCGSECREHIDPGFITSLLLGSEPGLEVLHGGQYVPVHQLVEEYDAVAAAPSPVLQPPVLVMVGQMTHVVSNLVIPSVKHRVAPGKWASESDRYNMIVELRPTKAMWQYSV